MASQLQDGRSGLGDVLLVIRKVPFSRVSPEGYDKLIKDSFDLGMFQMTSMPEVLMNLLFRRVIV